MASRHEALRLAAIDIVAAQQPCKATDLIRTLQRDYGASQREANTILFELIRDRDVKRTFFGELRVTGSGSGYPLIVRLFAVVMLLAIAAFIAWVFFQLLTQ